MRTRKHTETIQTYLSFYLIYCTGKRFQTKSGLAQHKAHKTQRKQQGRWKTVQQTEVKLASHGSEHSYGKSKSLTVIRTFRITTFKQIKINIGP